MLQGISDATNIGIYHAVTTKISKQKRIATLAIMIITTATTTKIRAITLIQIVSILQKLVTTFFCALNPPLTLSDSIISLKPYRKGDPYFSRQ